MPWFAALLLPLACAPAQGGGLRARLAQPMQPRAHPDDVAALAPLPRGVRRLADLAYGSDPAQRLDVYVPAHPRGDVVLMVHGGGWSRGDKAMASVVDNKLAHWAARGAIFISIDYRMLPAADPVRQADDVARALAWSQRHAREWGGDPGAFVLVGHSAGAHLAALLAADPSVARARGVRPWRGTIALDSAALDVERIMQGPHLSLYDAAFGADPGYWRAASPYRQLARGTAPMLLVCSTRRTESCANARRFATRAEALGGRAPVLPEPLSHTQVNDTLGLPGDYTRAVDAFIASLPLRR
jgi:acetyl esterase/lipase